MPQTHNSSKSKISTKNKETWLLGWIELGAELVGLEVEGVTDVGAYEYVGAHVPGENVEGDVEDGE
eukprot:118188-Amorphochlora_amoeboformis.AAC.1